MFQTLISYLYTYQSLSVVILLLITIGIMSLKLKNLPPSPGTALPLIGHLYMLEKNPRKQFQHWAEKFGDVFTLQMGPQRTVFVNTLEAMKEALIKQADHFSDRPNNSFLAKRLDFFTKGILFSSGANWKAQRSTTLAILRNFGMGKNCLAEKITEEVYFFTEELASRNGEPCAIRDLTNMSVSNVICSIIFGKRFQFDDPKFIAQMDVLNDVAKLNSGVMILNFLPCLYYIPFDLFKGRKLLNAYLNLLNFVCGMVHDIKQHHDDSKVDSYIVAYNNEMNKERDLAQSNYLNEDNLFRNITNLFAAGTETTSTTILWCLVFMLNYPDVQKKIYDEIVKHVGTERAPNMSDKPHMKYFAAVVMEVQRKASIVPLSVPHYCNSDTILSGYTIPKDTCVMPNLDAIHRSKEIWGDPENFRPERFLDEQGNIIKREELIPFSIGRRACLGASLAKMELFLYLTTLFQKFEFLPASPKKVPPLEDTWGLVAAPGHFVIRCVKRKA